MDIIRLQGDTERRKGIHYEVDLDNEPIGVGGTGKVYEGRCVNSLTGEIRSVAVKILFTNLPIQIIERARRESTIQLRNDNLIEMLGFIEMRNTYAVVSELLHGVSLTDIFNGKCTDSKGKEIPYARKLLNIYTKDSDHFSKIVAKNVLSGLMALHDAGYIHRDIDPSNIMITEDGHIKLIDFGICKRMDKQATYDNVQTVAGVFMGKPEYAAPELVLGDIYHQDQTTDIYAVGILMYQCVLGHVPFEGTRYEVLDYQVKEKLPTKNIKNNHLRRIIEKACSKKQKLRYQTTAEMRVAIESFESKLTGTTKDKQSFVIEIKWSSLKKIAIVLCLFCIAAVTFLLMNLNKPQQNKMEQVRTVLDSTNNKENATDSIEPDLKKEIAETESEKLDKIKDKDETKELSTKRKSEPAKPQPRKDASSTTSTSKTKKSDTKDKQLKNNPKNVGKDKTTNYPPKTPDGKGKSDAISDAISQEILLNSKY